MLAEHRDYYFKSKLIKSNWNDFSLDKIDQSFIETTMCIAGYSHYLVLKGPFLRACRWKFSGYGELRGARRRHAVSEICVRPTEQCMEVNMPPTKPTRTVLSVQNAGSSVDNTRFESG